GGGLGLGALALLRRLERLAIGFGARLRAPAKLAVERGALARRLGGTLFGFGHALRLGFQRLLAGDPRLELHGRGGLGGGELLGGTFERELRRATLARRALGIGFGARARQRRLARHLFGGARRA